jgi:hypothetical protein
MAGLRETGQFQAEGSDGSRPMVTEKVEQPEVTNQDSGGRLEYIDGLKRYFLPDGTELFQIAGAWTSKNTRITYRW